MFDHNLYNRPSHFKMTDKFPAWCFYYDDNNAPRGRYKLHICFDPNIAPDDLKKIQNELHNLLHAAIEIDLVPKYKTYNIEHVINSLHSSNITASEGQIRQMSNSFVIYLLDNDDDKYLHDIAQLIYNIEKLLANVKTTGIQAKCDLRIDTHVIFRQAYLDSDTTKSTYVRAIPKDPTDPKALAVVATLKAEGECSHHYNQIIAELAKIKFEKQFEPLKIEFSRKAARLVQALTTCRSLLFLEYKRLFEKYSVHDEKVIIISEKLVELDQKIEQFKKIIDSSITEEFKSHNDADTRLKEVATSLEQQALNSMKFSSENINTLFAHRGKAKQISEALYLTSDTQANLVEIAEKLKKDIKSNP